MTNNKKKSGSLEEFKPALQNEQLYDTRYSECKHLYSVISKFTLIFTIFF